MKVGIDLDNTITELPWFFKVLMKALQAEGHQVHVITFREDRSKAFEDLAEHGILCFNHLHTPDKEDKDPDTWKAKVATEVGLDLLIDDSPENLSAMPKSVATMWFVNREVFNLDDCLFGMRAKNNMTVIQ